MFYTNQPYNEKPHNLLLEHMKNTATDQKFVSTKKEKKSYNLHIKNSSFGMIQTPKS